MSKDEEDLIESLKKENKRLKDELIYVHSQLEEHCLCEQKICVCDMNEEQQINLTDTLNTILGKLKK